MAQMRARGLAGRALGRLVYFYRNANRLSVTRKPLRRAEQAKGKGSMRIIRNGHLVTVKDRGKVVAEYRGVAGLAKAQKHVADDAAAKQRAKEDKDDGST